MSISRPDSHQSGRGKFTTSLLLVTVLLNCHLPISRFTLGLFIIWQESFSYRILGLLSSPVWTILALPAMLPVLLYMALYELPHGWAISSAAWAKVTQLSHVETLLQWQTAEALAERVMTCCFNKIHLGFNTYNSVKDFHLIISPTACFWTHLKRFLKVAAAFWNTFSCLYSGFNTISDNILGFCNRVVDLLQPAWLLFKPNFLDVKLYVWLEFDTYYSSTHFNAVIVSVLQNQKYTWRKYKTNCTDT